MTFEGTNFSDRTTVSNGETRGFSSGADSLFLTADTPKTESNSLSVYDSDLGFAPSGDRSVVSVDNSITSGEVESRTSGQPDPEPVQKSSGGTSSEGDSTADADTAFGASSTESHQDAGREVARQAADEPTPGSDDNAEAASSASNEPKAAASDADETEGAPRSGGGTQKPPTPPPTLRSGPSPEEDPEGARGSKSQQETRVPGQRTGSTDSISADGERSASREPEPSADQLDKAAAREREIAAALEEARQEAMRMSNYEEDLRTLQAEHLLFRYMNAGREEGGLPPDASETDEEMANVRELERWAGLDTDVAESESLGTGRELEEVPGQSAQASHESRGAQKEVARTDSESAGDLYAGETPYRILTTDYPTLTPDQLARAQEIIANTLRERAPASRPPDSAAGLELPPIDDLDIPENIGTIYYSEAASQTRAEGVEMDEEIDPDLPVLPPLAHAVGRVAVPGTGDEDDQTGWARYDYASSSASSGRPGERPESEAARSFTESESADTQETRERVSDSEAAALMDKLLGHGAYRFMPEGAPLERSADRPLSGGEQAAYMLWPRIGLASALERLNYEQAPLSPPRLYEPEQLAGIIEDVAGMLKAWGRDIKNYLPADQRKILSVLRGRSDEEVAERLNAVRNQQSDLAWTPERVTQARGEIVNELMLRTPYGMIPPAVYRPTGIQVIEQPWAVGAVMNAIRLERGGVPVRELASSLGKSTSSVTDFLRGQSHPSVSDTLYPMLQILKVPAERGGSLLSHEAADRALSFSLRRRD